MYPKMPLSSTFKSEQLGPHYQESRTYHMVGVRTQRYKDLGDIVFRLEMHSTQTLLKVSSMDANCGRAC